LSNLKKKTVFTNEENKSWSLLKVN
jgi:hypothetical protein